MLQLELLSRTLRTMMYYGTEKERFPVEAAKLRFVLRIHPDPTSRRNALEMVSAPTGEPPQCVKRLLTP